MTLLRSCWLVLPALLVLPACGSGGSLCSNVVCSSGKVCEPTTGSCVRSDGGTSDAGPDAGDAGDGGATDGGDGGSTACNPPCAAGTFCDVLGTRTCVGCNGHQDCACPTPFCDATATPRRCIGPQDAGVPLPVAGDTCAGATSIPFAQCATSTRFTVDLTPLANDELGTCAPAGAGRDAIYLLDLPATFDVRVTVTATAGSPAQPVAYLQLNPCGSGVELSCHNGFGGPSSFRMRSLPAARYILVVDAMDGAGGQVEVFVELLPATLPANDTCSTPLDAPLDGGQFIIDLAPAAHDLSGTCNTTADSRDAVWRVNLTERADFHAVARRANGTAADPVLYLRAAPCNLGSELACVSSQAFNSVEHLRVHGLDAGTYYLVVEGRGAGGSEAIEVTTWAVPPVAPKSFDSCSSPLLITIPGSLGSANFTIDTGDFEDDESGSCSPLRSGGREAVYVLVLPDTRTVTVTARPADGGSDVDPLIYLRANRCARDAGVELFCEDDFSPTPEVATVSLDAGTYYMFIDSYESSSAGPTTVNVTLAP